MTLQHIKPLIEQAIEHQRLIQVFLGELDQAINDNDLGRASYVLMLAQDHLGPMHCLIGAAGEGATTDQVGD